MEPLNKKYLMCIVTRKNGTEFKNELKLSESYLISQMAQENRQVLVNLELCTKEYYDYLFN